MRQLILPLILACGLRGAAQTVIPMVREWEQHVTLSGYTIPSGISGSYLSGEGRVFSGEPDLFVLLSGFPSFASGSPYQNLFLQFGPEGRLKYRTPSLVKEGAILRSVRSLPNGNFELQIGDSLIRYDAQWKKIAGESLGGSRRFATPAQQILTVTSDGEGEGGKAGLSIRFAGQTARVPASSSLLDEGYFAASKAGFAYAQNNTVLQGPDHHDIQLSALRPDGSLNWHRQLTSASQLGRLFAQDVRISPEGKVFLLGTADDAVNFSATERFDPFGGRADRQKLVFEPPVIDSSSGIAEVFQRNSDRYCFLAVYDARGVFESIVTWEPFGADRYYFVAVSEDRVLFAHRQQAMLYRYDPQAKKLDRQPLQLPSGNKPAALYYQFLSPDRVCVIGVDEDRSGSKPPRFSVSVWRRK